MVEPGRVRAFARALGQRAKTDPIDAAVLSAFGRAVAPAPTAAPSAQQELLGALVLRRRQLVEFVVAESNRSAHYSAKPFGPELRAEGLPRRQAGALLRTLRAQIAACDKAIAAQIAEDETMKARAARLQEVPGVGAVTAATLLGEMPELGTLSDAGAAALAGVAPYNCDSGPFAGTRRIRGGRAPARCGLFMAAMSAVQHDLILQAFHQRLIEAGKKPMVALTAAMRKLIVLLNRLLKNPKLKLQAVARPEA